MAVGNYRVTSAQFKPLTYDELMKPIMLAEEQHRNVANAISEIQGEADKYKLYLQNNPSSPYAQQFNEYINKLDKAAGDLATQGMNPNTMNVLYGLKKDYNSTIVPVKEGVVARQKADDDFSKSKLGQSSRYIGVRPRDFDVTEYMYGKNPFKPGVAGEEVFNQAAILAKANADRTYQDYTKGGYDIHKLGYNEQETMAVMDKLRSGQLFDTNNVTDKNQKAQLEYYNSVIKDLRNNVFNPVVTDYGIGREDFTDEMKGKIANEAIMGIYAGLHGDEKREVNRYALIDYEDKKVRQRELDKQAGGNGDGSQLPITQTFNQGLPIPNLNQSYPTVLRGDTEEKRRAEYKQMQDEYNQFVTNTNNLRNLEKALDKIREDYRYKTDPTSVSVKNEKIRQAIEKYGGTVHQLKRAIRQYTKSDNYRFMTENALVDVSTGNGVIKKQFKTFDAVMEKDSILRDETSVEYTIGDIKSPNTLNKDFTTNVARSLQKQGTTTVGVIPVTDIEFVTYTPQSLIEKSLIVKDASGRTAKLPIKDISQEHEQLYDRWIANIKADLARQTALNNSKTEEELIQNYQNAYIQLANMSHTELLNYLNYNENKYFNEQLQLLDDYYLQFTDINQIPALTNKERSNIQ